MLTGLAVLERFRQQVNRGLTGVHRLQRPFARQHDELEREQERILGLLVALPANPGRSAVTKRLG